MKFSEIAGRVTGFSTPIFGVSWTPPRVDVEVAARVLLVLEDRRVLYSPYEAEMPEHCVASVLEIRRFLTEQLAQGGIATELSDSLRAMRSACRKFLETLPDRPDAQRSMGNWGTPGWVFNQALGELRGVFGLHVAQLAVRYGIDVPDPLASIMPLNTEQDSNPASGPAGRTDATRSKGGQLVSDASDTIWTFANVGGQNERKTRLALSWELNGDPITDDYLPDEASAGELWDMWIKRYAQPVMEIYWFVFSPAGILETAPFSRSDTEQPDFLTYFSWPENESGERLRWTSLRVIDKLWRPDQADKGGFIQELTGWKPSPFSGSRTLTSSRLRATYRRQRPHSTDWISSRRRAPAVTLACVRRAVETCAVDASTAATITAGCQNADGSSKGDSHLRRRGLQNRSPGSC